MIEGDAVLVTGGAGFIGGRLVETLHDDPDGPDVRVLDRDPGPDLPAGVRVIEGDVRDPGTVERAVAGIDVVFHQAALVDVAASVDAPRKSHATNVAGALTVLEAAREHDARVVVASSAAVYGDPEEVPVAETARPDPLSPYGLEKLTADRYARLYARLYGLDAVALRYFNVYGPGQTGGDYAGVIETFLRQARNGDPITVHGDGEQTRDFVHVDDIVRANLLAADTDAVGAAYNVGTGTSVTIRRLAERIRETVGSDSSIVHTEPRSGDIRHSRADVSRARERLGYEPTVDLREGLESLAADAAVRSGES